MRHLLHHDGYDLWQYESDDIVPSGFVLPIYRIDSPEGIERRVSADKLKDALDELFEVSA